MARRKRERPIERPGTPARILGAGPRVVLLHGGPGLDHHVLLPFAEQLASSFEIWLPDLPGHGAHAGRTAPGLADTVQRLERWLAGLGDAVDAVVGHSLGAYLARELLRHGYAPGAAVLIAPPAGDRDRALLGWPRMKRERRVTEAEMRAALIAEVRNETGQPASPAFAAALDAAALRSPNDFDALFRSLALALSHPTPRCRPRCPVLVVSGALDAVVTPHQAARVAAATTGAELVTVPDEGHLPAATGARSIADAVQAFLERHVRR